MYEDTNSFRIYKAFLDHFVDEGVTEIPFELNKFQAAFYRVLIEDSYLATKWGLVKRANPAVGKLDEIMPWFHNDGLAYIGTKGKSHFIFVENLSRFTDQPSEIEIMLGKRIHDKIGMTARAIIAAGFMGIVCWCTLVSIEVGKEVWALVSSVITFVYVSQKEAE